MKKYLLFDCETGGLNENATLLTLYAKILDANFQEISSLDLKIKPPHGQYYILDAASLKINKIDIVKHDAEAISYDDAREKLRVFLSTNSLVGKLTPVGHNIAFDIKFASKLLPSWNDYCEYRSIDTSSIAQFLQLAGTLPDGISSLEKLCDYFGFDTSNHHNAKADVEMTQKLLKQLILCCQI